MFEALEKYTEKGKFIFNPNDKLVKVCASIPDDKSGVYLIYAFTGKVKELIFIGRSGQLLYGYPKHRKGGLRGKFTSGKQQLGYEVANSCQVSWPKKMKDDKIDHLEVHWFITLDETVKDCPMILEESLLKKFEEKEGHVPAWNKYE